MNALTPPPLPRARSARLDGRNQFLIGLAVVSTIFIIILRAFGLVRTFSVPTGAMTPAISAGDRVVMERITFLARKPCRGDIVVFRTDGIALLPPGEFYVKRVAGEPGDRVRIAEGKLFVDEKQVSLSNAVGEIVYDLPRGSEISARHTNATVPDDCYFVLGDNSTNSLDSRYWGGVPRQNIIGRVSFCYWPPQRMGGVK